MEKIKPIVNSLYNFIEDTEGLTDSDLVAELREQGVDVPKLEKRVAEIVKKGSEKRRMAWRATAQKKRIEIEQLFESKKSASGIADLKSQIKNLFSGNYGQAALSFAEAYFRKKDAITEKDLESLVEDLQDLNLLVESESKED